MCSPWRWASMSSSPGGHAEHSRNQSPGPCPLALQVQPGWSPCHLSLPPWPPPSRRHCPVFITAAHHTLLLDLPQKWSDHGIPLPHSLPWLPLALWEELSAVGAKETTSPHLPCSSSYPEHFHFLLREGLGL